MVEAIFNAENWSRVPSAVWGAVFFVLGSMVGSFLNVCIHRLPLGQSVIAPPSHCPHCKYSIPWFLNIPLITWLYLRGKCKNCGAPISVRYFIVELLTGVAFLGCWLAFGEQSVLLTLVYSVFVSGLIAATFIDFDHFIIPDEITIGGMVVGVLLSALAPGLHAEQSWIRGVTESVLGLIAGGGVLYAIVRGGKLLFGRQRVELPGDTRIIFGETSVRLPDKEIPYEDLFYRRSDAIALHARTVELADRCYKDVTVRLAPDRLQIGDDRFNPEDVPCLEAVSAEIVLPREAMGFGDVKFMAAIGAFMGWQAVVFTLLLSSVVGAVVGVTLIAIGKRELGSRMPYGPYIALAAVVWLFWGEPLRELMLNYLVWRAA